MEYFFNTKGLAVGYDGKPLIRDIEIRLEKGHILTLIGPNGAGKSTILKTITKHLAGIAGTIFLGGENVNRMSYRSLARRVSVVLTQRMQTDRLSCREVVATGRYPYTGTLGILAKTDEEKVEAAMALTHTQELAGRDFMCISDGQRQRVLLARAIAQEPEIIVLDEPTSFLDIRYELELLDILRRMAREQGITVIMSLHELDLAQRISDDVMCVKGDVISDYGPAEQIFTRERISRLYDLKDGSYNPLFGSVEMRRPEGEPEVFVIAGGGSGVDTFRSLQKQGIPFAVGVLHENDVDCLVAADLAAELVTEQAFMPISDAAYEQAVAVMRRCSRVINCLAAWGETNRRNQTLLEKAREMGLPISSGK